MSSISLQIAVQPPAVVRRGVALDPPLAVKMTINATINGYNGDLGHIWAFATLLNRNGEVVSDSLTGNLAESAHAFANGDGATGYFLFENIAIQRAGTFRIRVTLMQIDSPSDGSTASGVASVEQVDSSLVHVEDREVHRQAPSYTEQRFLDALPDEY